jgi:hypothetical protein
LPADVSIPEIVELNNQSGHSPACDPEFTVAGMIIVKS